MQAAVTLKKKVQPGTQCNIVHSFLFKEARTAGNGKQVERIIIKPKTIGTMPAAPIIARVPYAAGIVKTGNAQRAG